jgi:hypothetical protein
VEKGDIVVFSRISEISKIKQWVQARAPLQDDWRGGKQNEKRD